METKINKAILLLSSFLVITATASSKASGYEDPSKTESSEHTKANFPGSWVTLGVPTYKDAEFPVSPSKCVDTNPAKIFLNNPEGQINMSNIATKQQLSTSFGFGYGIGASWDIFSASAGANYLHETIDNAYTQNFSYLQTVTGTANLNTGYGVNGVLNETGKAALADGVTAFQRTCGDSFISSAAAGVVLSVNIQVVFNSSADKQKFTAAIGGGVKGIAEINAAFTKARDKTKVSANIIVSAIQMGGNPEDLAKIFNKKQKGEYYVSTCNMDNLNDCGQIINGTLDYAQGLGAQIKTPSGAINLNKLYYGSPMLTEYSRVGVQIPTVKLNYQNTNRLVDLMKKLQSQYITVAHYIPLVPSSLIASNSMLDDLNDQLDHLNNSKKYLANVAELCFAIDKTSKDCRDAITNAEALFSRDLYYAVNDEAIEDIKYAWHYQNPVWVADLKHDVIFRPIVFGNTYSRRFYGYDLLGGTHELSLDANGVGAYQLAGRTQLNNNPYFDLCDFEYKHVGADGYQYGKCTNTKGEKFFARIKRIYNPEM